MPYIIKNGCAFLDDQEIGPEISILFDKNTFEIVSHGKPSHTKDMFDIRQQLIRQGPVFKSTHDHLLSSPWMIITVPAADSEVGVDWINKVLEIRSTFMMEVRQYASKHGRNDIFAVSCYA